LGVAAPVVVVALAVSLLEPFACHVKIGPDLVPEEAAKCFEFWLNRYQTLIGGVLTLIAGSFAYFAAQKQINHAESLEQRRRSAEEVAARAHLSFALDEVFSYTDQCLIKCADIYDMNGNGGSSDLQFPNVSLNAIQLMQNCIRFTNEESRKNIVKLMSVLQIVKARLGDLRVSWQISDAEKIVLCHRIVNIYAIRFLVSGLLEYSRFEVEFFKHMAFYHYIKFEIKKSRFDPSRHPELYEIIEGVKNFSDDFYNHHKI